MSHEVADAHGRPTKIKITLKELLQDKPCANFALGATDDAERAMLEQVKSAPRLGCAPECVPACACMGSARRRHVLKERWFAVCVITTEWLSMHFTEMLLMLLVFPCCNKWSLQLESGLLPCADDFRRPLLGS